MPTVARGANGGKGTPLAALIRSIFPLMYIIKEGGNYAFVEGAFGAIRCDSGDAGPFCYINNARAYCYVFVHCNGSRIGICKTEI